jgi:hypothetical protein
MDIVKVKSVILIFVFISAGFVFGGKVLACGDPPPEPPGPCYYWHQEQKWVYKCKCACLECDESTGDCYEDCNYAVEWGCCCASDGKGECCLHGEYCCDGYCCKSGEECCDGDCCPEDKCCVDGDCIEGGCRPRFDLVESGECGCYAFECEGSITQTFIWYCEEYDGGCPSGTECVQTGWEECYTTRTEDCIGECLVYGSECAFGNWEFGPKAPRVLCGCCP